MKLQNGITAALFALLLAPFQLAHATTATLKRVQITDGSRVDLLFDAKVSARQIRTEFFNDIIQVSLTDVSVYPAKINSLSGSELTKVFAYQYAPKLTRCRLSVKGNAETFKDRFEVKAEGKIISLRMLPQAAAAPSSSEASPSRARLSAEEAKRSVASNSDLKEKAEEQALLQRVISGAPASAPAQAASATAPTKSEPVAAPKAVEPTASASTASKAVSSGPLAGGKPLPSPWRSIGMLMVVVCAFLAFAWITKKVKGGTGLNPVAAISNAAGKSNPLGKILSQFGGSKAKMIEVVANHYLGPKKSISVVRIGTRMLVLGVTNESINLITQLDAGNTEAQQAQAQAQAMANFDLESLALESAGWAAPEAPVAQPAPVIAQRAPRPSQVAAQIYGTGATSAGPARPATAAPSAFSQILGSEAAKPSVRSQIRSRLEGMKQL